MKDKELTKEEELKLELEKIQQEKINSYIEELRALNEKYQLQIQPIVQLQIIPIQK